MKCNGALVNQSEPAISVNYSQNIKGNNICTYIMDTVKKSERNWLKNLELTLLSAYNAQCGVFILFVLLYILSFENKNQVHNKWLNALKCKKNYSQNIPRLCLCSRSQVL